MMSSEVQYNILSSFHEPKAPRPLPNLTQPGPASHGQQPMNLEPHEISQKHYLSEAIAHQHTSFRPIYIQSSAELLHIPRCLKTCRRPAATSPCSTAATCPSAVSAPPTTWSQWRVSAATVSTELVRELGNRSERCTYPWRGQSSERERTVDEAWKIWRGTAAGEAKRGSSKAGGRRTRELGSK